jgi:hypothetical protein
MLAIIYRRIQQHQRKFIAGVSDTGGETLATNQLAYTSKGINSK